MNFRASKSYGGSILEGVTLLLPTTSNRSRRQLPIGILRLPEFEGRCFIRAARWGSTAKVG